MKRLNNIRRHEPQRTCVGCRQAKPKRELVRLVRGDDGSIESDAAGTKAGRGAYLCRAPGCWEVALDDDRLGHALRATVSSENREQLVKYGEQLVRESISGRGR